MRKSNRITKANIKEHMIRYKVDKEIRRDNKERKEFIEEEYWYLMLKENKTEYDKQNLVLLGNLI